MIVNKFCDVNLIAKLLDYDVIYRIEKECREEKPFYTLKIKA